MALLGLRAAALTEEDADAVSFTRYVHAAMPVIFDRPPQLASLSPNAVVEPEVLRRILHLVEFTLSLVQGHHKSQENQNILASHRHCLPACQAISQVEPFTSVDNRSSWQAGLVIVFIAAVEHQPFCYNNLHSHHPHHIL